MHSSNKYRDFTHIQLFWRKVAQWAVLQNIMAFHSDEKNTTQVFLAGKLHRACQYM